ncbi:hypothetical protein DPMN_046418 [Dreissena polymorpha]|uniref:Uncharacterized protein n=1 Tax=Dreissena polymorpha TaxID=45954 RepID=A0A9D4D8C7_DREPO|nr:hypothetical protein DPMN_046418 [Dreissena polymorpha]
MQKARVAFIVQKEVVNSVISFTSPTGSSPSHSVLLRDITTSPSSRSTHQQQTTKTSRSKFCEELERIIANFPKKDILIIQGD